MCPYCRHFRGGESRDQSEGQRHLVLDPDGRVATGEDEPQLVVVHGLWILRACSGVGPQPIGRDLLGELASSVASTDDVDGPVSRGGDDPAGGVVRDAIARPPIHGGHEGVLDRVLGEREVTEEAGQSGHGLAVGLAERPLDIVHPTSPSVAGPGLEAPGRPERPHLDRVVDGLDDLRPTPAPRRCPPR